MSLSHLSSAPARAAALPRTYWQAALRGIKGTCPRCGEGKLFRAFLKPQASCAACGQDWSHQCADDFPAYIAILVTGHVLAPLIILLSLDFDMSVGGMFAVIVPLALVMMLGMLQPSKGAVIATQWWHGLHGFKRERALPAEGAPQT